MRSWARVFVFAVALSGCGAAPAVVNDVIDEPSVSPAVQAVIDALPADADACVVAAPVQVDASLRSETRSMSRAPDWIWRDDAPLAAATSTRLHSDGSRAQQIIVRADMTLAGLSGLLRVRYNVFEGPCEQQPADAACVQQVADGVFRVSVGVWGPTGAATRVAQRCRDFVLAHPDGVEWAANDPSADGLALSDDEAFRVGRREADALFGFERLLMRIRGDEIQRVHFFDLPEELVDDEHLHLLRRASERNDNVRRAERRGDEVVVEEIVLIEDLRMRLADRERHQQLERDDEENAAPLDLPEAVFQDPDELFSALSAQLALIERRGQDEQFQARAARLSTWIERALSLYPENQSIREVAYGFWLQHQPARAADVAREHTRRLFDAATVRAACDARLARLATTEGFASVAGAIELGHPEAARPTRWVAAFMLNLAQTDVEHALGALSFAQRTAVLVKSVSASQTCVLVDAPQRQEQAPVLQSALLRGAPATLLSTARRGWNAWDRAERARVVTDALAVLSTVDARRVFPTPELWIAFATQQSASAFATRMRDVESIMCLVDQARVMCADEPQKLLRVTGAWLATQHPSAFR